MTAIKLTAPQLRRLKDYAQGDDAFIARYKPDAKLLELGLIARCDQESRMGAMRFITFRARLTPAGQQLYDALVGHKERRRTETCGS